MTTDRPPGDRRKTDSHRPERKAPPARRESDRAPGVETLPVAALGRYKLLRKLGSGAMAHVYLAEDPAMQRQVAVKTLKLADEFADSDLAQAREQFQREARAGGRLSHPNIVGIYDFGEQDELSFLVMEYCRGQPMTAYKTPDKLLPTRWILELTAQAADALHYAHGQGVVHRDIKPANLMYDANADLVKITDFGIARLTDTVRTRTGVLQGTPNFMAPEQFTGGTVDGRTDLFSLGVTAYQLLTGTAPFRAQTLPKLLDLVVHQPHEPASHVKAGLPAGLDEVLVKVLAKDPDDRYPNGRAMAIAIRDLTKSL